MLFIFYQSKYCPFIFKPLLHQKVVFRTNSNLPYHRVSLLQKGRGIGGIFNSLFKTLLPIGKAAVKSTPSILRNTAKSPLGRKLKKISKKIAFTTAKNLIESGDINKTIKKSVQDSKRK